MFWRGLINLPLDAWFNGVVQNGACAKNTTYLPYYTLFINYLPDLQNINTFFVIFSIKSKCENFLKGQLIPFLFNTTADANRILSVVCTSVLGSI